MKKIILLLTFALTGLFNAQAQLMTCTLSLNMPAPNGSTIQGYASFNNGTMPSSGTVSFDMGDGTVINTGNQFSYTYQNSGTYIVCASVSDSINNLYCTDCDTVVIGNGTPTCSTSFTAYRDTSVANGIYFYMTNSGTAPFTYAFTYGDSTYGASVTHAYPDTVSYYACVTTTDANGCVANFCGYVTTNPNTGSSCVTYIGLSNNGLVATGYAYGNGSPNTTTYSWDFGDGSTGTGSQFSHTYTQAGLYNVCVTTTDFLSSCTSYTCDSIYVTGSAGGNCSNTFTGLVAGNNVSFTANPVGGTAPYTESWDFGDNSTGTGNAPTHTYAMNGTYQVCLTTTDANGCSYTSCNYVNIGTSTPSCQAYFWMFPDSLNGTPNGVWYAYDLSNTGNTGSLDTTAYIWDFGDGTTSNQQYPTHTYAVPGSYVVCLTIETISNPGGVAICTSSYCDSSSVQRTMNTSMTSISVLPNPSAVKNINSSKNITVSPNPSNGNAYLNVAGAANSSLKVYDMLGNLISANKATNANYQLDISELNSGTYILTISNNNNVTNKKFVVTK